MNVGSIDGTNDGFKSVRAFSSMHVYTERVLCFGGGGAAPAHSPAKEQGGFLRILLTCPKVS